MSKRQTALLVGLAALCLVDCSRTPKREAPKPSSPNPSCPTLTKNGAVSQSATESMIKNGHRFQLTYNSSITNAGMPNATYAVHYVLERDGANSVTIDIAGDPSGLVSVQMQAGVGFDGWKEAKLQTHDRATVDGTIDGRQLRSFKLKDDPHGIRFGDGGELPASHVDADVMQVVQQLGNSIRLDCFVCQPGDAGSCASPQSTRFFPFSELPHSSDPSGDAACTGCTQSTIAVGTGCLAPAAVGAVGCAGFVPVCLVVGVIGCGVTALGTYLGCKGNCCPVGCPHGGCCDTGETCIATQGGTQDLCCSPGLTTCGDESCCGPNETCLNGSSCCISTSLCGTSCCTGEQTCNHNTNKCCLLGKVCGTRCCNANEYCANDATSTCSLCQNCGGSNQTCCDGNCCSLPAVCDLTSGACVCNCGTKCGGVPDGCGGKCNDPCPSGQTCYQGTCCQPTCDGKTCGADDGCGGYCPQGPNCKNKHCGDSDNCGGTCGGSCADSTLVCNEHHQCVDAPHCPGLGDCCGDGSCCLPVQSCSHCYCGGRN